METLTCPNCGTGTTGADFCPDCGLKIGDGETCAPVPGNRQLRPRVVHRSLDELSALTLQKVLEAEGLECWVRSAQRSGVDAMSAWVEGYWGEVLVFEDQETAARTVIERHLRNLGSGVH
jgi:hypothetical protein